MSFCRTFGLSCPVTQPINSCGWSATEEQFSGTDSKGVGQPLTNVLRWTAAASFKSGDVGLVNARPLGELVLREALASTSHAQRHSHVS